METRLGEESLRAVFLLQIFGMVKYIGSQPTLRRVYISHADLTFGGVA